VGAGHGNTPIIVVVSSFKSAGMRRLESILAILVAGRWTDNSQADCGDRRSRDIYNLYCSSNRESIIAIYDAARR
jgi:hypothetical protein